MQWMKENIEWIFSGVGIVIVTYLINITKKGYKFVFRGRSSISDAKQGTRDSSRFVEENPPDGVPCRVGEKFVKTWTIRNDGNVVWRKRYMVCQAPVYDLEQSAMKVKMPTIYPGEEYTLKITYVAKVEGIYRSYWKMYDENNNMLFPKMKGLGVTIIAKEKLN